MHTGRGAMYDLIIKGISAIISFTCSPVRGKMMNMPLVIENGCIACKDGLVAFVGQERELPGWQAAEIVDASGGIATPGLVDPHTHLVFAGDRSDEYELRLKGLSYEDIRARGGGIIKTVEKTRQASRENLIERGRFFASQFISQGTTTLEAKSGYGLTTESEIKILESINAIGKSCPLDIIPTFLGAHTIPEGLTPETYTEKIVEEMLPAIKERGLARFCDVFVEKSEFGIHEAQRILERAKELGFGLKVHSNQFTDLGGVELAVKLECRSADHLEIISDEDIAILAGSNTSAVLLPGCSFFLDYHYAPARKLIDAGAIVALGTDFNPGSSPTISLPLIMAIACSKMRMLPYEALAAVTTNAAYALGVEKECGTLEVGKKADIVIWNAKSVTEIPYYFGANLVKNVIKNGRVVV